MIRRKQKRPGTKSRRRARGWRTISRRGSSNDGRDKESTGREVGKSEVRCEGPAESLGAGQAEQGRDTAAAGAGEGEILLRCDRGRRTSVQGADALAIGSRPAKKQKGLPRVSPVWEWRPGAQCCQCSAESQVANSRAPPFRADRPKSAAACCIVYLVLHKTHPSRSKMFLARETRDDL